MGDIQVLQNKAARIVCDAPPRAPRKTLYDKLGWLTVNQLIVYHTLVLVFKIRSCSEPEYLALKMKNDSRNGRIIVPHVNLQLAQRSFSFRGAVQWNGLPVYIRNLVKIGAFKKNLRQWIQNNIPRFSD